MLSVFKLEIPSEVPIVGCELTPKLVLTLPDNTTSTADVLPSDPVDGLYLSYKWYRVSGSKSSTRCSLHPSEPATLQCSYCSNRQSLIAKSYHCSSKCFQDAWPSHKAAHELAEKSGEAKIDNYGPSATINPGKEESQCVVGHGRTYTPRAQDVGCVLKLEVTVVSAKTRTISETHQVSTTNYVVSYPTPVHRRLISISGFNVIGQPGTFTVLSYNILSDTSATNPLFNYCQPWARTWTYRRTNLVREIVRYSADVVCLQEVQDGHLENFLAPELEKHGYDVQYKRRTNEVLSGLPITIDGCATFFKRDRFSFVKKYDIEFNKYAHALVEAAVPSNQKALATERLIKDNVALIVVLEPKFASQQQPAGPSGKHPLICVANTHIDVPEDMNDVMIWQVHTLLKGIERVAESGSDMPMVMCGDFNMLPGSAAHSLVAMGSINPQHPQLSVDPFGILQPQSKLAHHLPLVSAYSAFSRLPMGAGLDKHRMSIHRDTNEPLFTICTKEFTNCHDYIFHTGNNLRVESLMELVDEMRLRENTALPSTRWSSSHIALLAQFRCRPSS